MSQLSIIYQEMYLAHKRNKWLTVVWLASKSRPLRLELLAKNQLQGK